MVVDSHQSYLTKKYDKENTQEKWDFELFILLKPHSNNMVGKLYAPPRHMIHNYSAEISCSVIKFFAILWLERV